MDKTFGPVFIAKVDLSGAYMCISVYAKDKTFLALISPHTNLTLNSSLTLIYPQKWGTSSTPKYYELPPNQWLTSSTPPDPMSILSFPTLLIPRTSPIQIPTMTLPPYVLILAMTSSTSAAISPWPNHLVSSSTLTSTWTTSAPFPRTTTMYAPKPSITFFTVFTFHPQQCDRRGLEVSEYHQILHRSNSAWTTWKKYWVDGRIPQPSNFPTLVTTWAGSQSSLPQIIVVV